ncbi:MAG: hypothetical protein IPK60_18180 [Sandaracinaceae bacterium]|nr:hypothetical protein [Sandaracinaceae bacterium]
MRRIHGWGLLALMLCGVHASTAQAGGFEYTGAGTRSMGRGGAAAAAPDDPMALQFNPAMLSELPGGQLMLNLNNAMFDACVSRPGTYAQDGTSGMTSVYGNSNEGTYEGRNLPTVCNQNSGIGPGLSLAYTHRVSRNIGIGFGILTPMAAGHSRYSNADGSVTVDGTRLPSPVRYNLIEQNHLQIFPTVGIGWKVNSWLHVGIALQWGIVTVSNQNIAVSQMSGEPATDLYADIQVHDYFVPAIIASVQVHPMPGLDLMIGARWIDSIRAGGTASITANRYADPNASPMANQVTTAVNGVSLNVPQGSSISIGARYGVQRRRSGGEAELDALRVPDRMNDEIFDLEVNATYELNSAVDQFELQIPDGATVDIGDGPPGPHLPPQVTLPHHWKNQLVMRLGGDWNVLPGLLAVRAGMHFETSGITPAYTQLDFLPAQRIGLHVGATVRLGKFDLSAAYSHIFQETLVVDSSIADYHQIAVLDEGRVINNGTYTSHFNVLSLGGTYHF